MRDWYFRRFTLKSATSTLSSIFYKPYRILFNYQKLKLCIGLKNQTLIILFVYQSDRTTNFKFSYIPNNNSKQHDETNIKIVVSGTNHWRAAGPYSKNWVRPENAQTIKQSSQWKVPQTDWNFQKIHKHAQIITVNNDLTDKLTHNKTVYHPDTTVDHRPRMPSGPHPTTVKLQHHEPNIKAFRSHVFSQGHRYYSQP
jgi:hypothetical protein